VSFKDKRNTREVHYHLPVGAVAWEILAAMQVVMLVRYTV